MLRLRLNRAAGIRIVGASGARRVEACWYQALSYLWKPRPDLRPR